MMRVDASLVAALAAVVVGAGISCTAGTSGAPESSTALPKSATSGTDSGPAGLNPSTPPEMPPFLAAMRGERYFRATCPVAAAKADSLRTPRAHLPSPDAIDLGDRSRLAA
jgi:hypothetical protein